MYNSILVPIAPDHATTYRPALEAARKLASNGAEIIALTVLDEVPEFVAAQIPHEIYKNRVIEAEKALKDEIGDATDVTPVVVSGHSYRSILDYADRKSCECIVITSHQPEFSDFLIGSTAARVVRHAKCNVMVLR